MQERRRRITRQAVQEPESLECDGRSIGESWSGWRAIIADELVVAKFLGRNETSVMKNQSPKECVWYYVQVRKREKSKKIDQRSVCSTKYRRGIRIRKSHRKILSQRRRTDLRATKNSG